MEPSDLPVVEYLNQRIVFDLLATVEGGFSQVENVTSTAGRRDGSEALLSGELGSSNIFALIGVKLGASLRGAKETSSTDAVEREVVHTPTSLFARLREYLTDERLVVAATAAVPGAFVEFEAKLRKNPLLDAMEGIVGIVRMFGGITAGDARPKGGTDPKKMLAQMQSFVEALTPNGRTEFVADIVDGGRALLTVDLDYFTKGSAADIAEGRFRVFGKVVQVHPEGSEGINLLRKTSLSRFRAEALETMMSGFGGMSEAGLVLPAFENTVEPPVFEVVPIAIFV